MFKRCLSAALCAVMLISCFPLFSTSAESRKTVYFGSYFQNRIYDRTIVEALEEMRFTNDRATLNGVTFARKSSAYYPKEPVEWLVLKEDGNSYTLMSKHILEYRSFSNNFWKDSELRSWMNSQLYNELFSSTEKQNVLTTANLTWYHPYEDAYINKLPARDELTNDKLYLLTTDDVQNGGYGFATDSSDSPTRVARATYYANNGTPADNWWLRESFWSTGNLKTQYVSANGGLKNWYGTYTYGVRPVVRVNKSAVTSVKPVTNLPVLSSYYTSTTSVYPTEFENIKKNADFSTFSSSLMDDIVIPGIKQTNTNNTMEGLCKNMVAQGFCIANETAEGALMLISAYDGSKKNRKNSVIYVLNATNGKYMNTLVLQGNKSHVGGLAYNPVKREFYIADSDSNKIHILPYYDVLYACSRTDAVEITLENSFKVDLTPSFVSYYGGNIYVGTHAKNVLKLTSSRLYAYSTKDYKRINDFSIPLPLKTQGVQMAYYQGRNYLICSCSYGRNSKSHIRIYELNKQRSGYKLTRLTESVSHTFPHMAEDIHVENGNLYITYESASKKYQSGVDKCPYPLDRITAHELSALLPGSLRARSVGDTVLSKGRCGQYLYYTLYSSGYMRISGVGKMYNYDFRYSIVPWNNYKSAITTVDMDADVTSIGENAFYGCENLTTVRVTNLSDTSAAFSFSNNAFANCPALQEVQLPNKSISFTDTCFDTTSTALRFYSDATDVKSYVASHSAYTLHQHTFTRSRTVAATCAGDGYDVYTCSCGLQTTHNQTAATAHKFKETARKNATCTTEGYVLYTCTVCGDSADEELPAQHTYHNKVSKTYLRSKATAASAAVYYKSCKICGTKGTSTFKSGKPLKGPAMCKVDGKWGYYRSGKLDRKSNTLVKHDGKWRHVKNGRFSKETTLVKYKGSYYYVKNGVRSSANTLVKYKGKWYHVNKGKKVKDTTLVKYKGTYYYVKNGIRNSATTLVKYKGKLYYVKKGKWSKSTTLVTYKKKQYYVRSGKVSAVSKTVKVNGKRYLLKKGIVVKKA